MVTSNALDEEATISHKLMLLAGDVIIFHDRAYDTGMEAESCSRICFT